MSFLWPNILVQVPNFLLRSRIYRSYFTKPSTLRDWSIGRSSYHLLFFTSELLQHSTLADRLTSNSRSLTDYDCWTHTSSGSICWQKLPYVKTMLSFFLSHPFLIGSRFPAWIWSVLARYGIRESDLELQKRCIGCAFHLASRSHHLTEHTQYGEIGKCTKFVPESRAARRKSRGAADYSIPRFRLSNEPTRPIQGLIWLLLPKDLKRQKAHRRPHRSTPVEVIGEGKLLAQR